jgi:hypothetical protein
METTAGGTSNDVGGGRDEYECSGWAARFSRREGKITVTATCAMPTPGYTLKLSANVNQGINPRDALRLVIEATPPDGAVPAVLTETPVQFERVVGDDGPPWPRVVIINASPPASIDIEHVS